MTTLRCACDGRGTRREGVVAPPLFLFIYFFYFFFCGNILPLIDNLSCALQNEIIFNYYSAKASVISPNTYIDNKSQFREKFIEIYNLLLSKRLTTIFYLAPFLTQQAANAKTFAELKLI